MIYDFGLVFHADYDGDIRLTQKIVFVDFQDQKMVEHWKSPYLHVIHHFRLIFHAESDGGIRFAWKWLFRCFSGVFHKKLKTWKNRSKLPKMLKIAVVRPRKRENDVDVCLKRFFGCWKMWKRPFLIALRTRAPGVPGAYVFFSRPRKCPRSVTFSRRVKITWRHDLVNQKS